jgi:hypothetical protein
MKRSIIRKFAVLALAVAAATAPTAAFAEEWGIWYFNDGNGTCGYISCGENGCTVIDTFPCPREVGGG